MVVGVLFALLAGKGFLDHSIKSQSKNVRKWCGKGDAACGGGVSSDPAGGAADAGAEDTRAALVITAAAVHIPSAAAAAAVAVLFTPGTSHCDNATFRP